eukprot:66930-Chlamydomonas_euryale.AAC.4
MPNCLAWMLGSGPQSCSTCLAWLLGSCPQNCNTCLAWLLVWLTTPWRPLLRAFRLPAGGTSGTGAR